MRILIVDDMPDARQVLRYMVERNSNEAIEAENGSDGLRIAKNSPPDFIISDALMPVMDGFKFLRAVRQEPELRSIPFVIYSSSYKDDQDVRLAMSLGANAYFLKPIDPVELWEKIKSILKKATQNDHAPTELIKEDAEYLRRYSEVVATKLEEKVLELEKALAERKLAEVTLQESVARMRAITDSAQDAILMMNQNGYVSYWNPAAERIFGFTSKETIGRDLHQLIVPEYYQKAWLAAFAKFQLTGQGNAIDTTLELKACHKNGHEISVELSLSALHYQDGWHSVGIVRDITERTWTEELLKQQEKELTAIFENAPFIIFLLDGERRIRRMNALACSFTGSSITDMVGIRVGEALHCLHAFDNPEGYGFWQCCQQCTLRQTIRDTHETGRSHLQVETSLSCLNKDKEQSITFLISTTRIIVYKSPLVLLSLQDITEHKKLEEQFRQAQKMEAIGTLAGGVAHDFNNMLGVILGHAELAMELLDPALPIFDNLQAIIKTAMRSADLTRQLLAFARQQPIAPRVLNLNETVEGMIKMLWRLIGEDIELVWLPEAGVCPVKMDPSQIDQILANLCVNARDAIAGVGKITIETHSVNFDKAFCADHPGFVPGEYVLLAVSDNGCGMDKETLEKLFEPFFTTKEIGKGTGLGLATVYGIVKQNNAIINVYSEPEQGTTFKIYLPRHMAKNEEMWKESPVTQVTGGDETILLVEDDPTVLEMARLMLKRLGYQVLSASNPSEAIHLTRKHAAEIHLLITDVILPEMNGPELGKTLISFSPSLKVLFMSGYTGDVIARQGVLVDGINFIQKPFSKEILAAKVRDVLDGN